MTEQAQTGQQDDLDRFYTPAWATRALLNRVDFDGPVLEPCAGDGHIVSVLEDEGYEVEGRDIDPESRFEYIDATEEFDWPEGFKSIITNPPYSCEAGTASEVANAAYRYMDAHQIALLLRITWLEPCDDRSSFFYGSDKPSSIIVLPRVHYITPGTDTDSGNPATSMWVYWDFREFDTETEIEWVKKPERDRLQGQKELI